MAMGALVFAAEHLQQAFGIVGTVAAGVSKAHADVVLISGHDGGTGSDGEPQPLEPVLR